MDVHRYDADVAVPGFVGEAIICLQEIDTVIIQLLNLRMDADIGADQASLDHCFQCLDLQ